MSNLIRLLSRFMWIPLSRKKPEVGKCCIVTWSRNTGSAGGRYAYYQLSRKYGDEDLGPGFVCWYTGTPLTDQVDYWIPPLRQP